MAIGIYDLLPLVLRTRDQEASSGPSGPILQRLLGAFQQEADFTEALILGLRELINLETTQNLILGLIARQLGCELPPNLSEFHRRESTKLLVDSYKIKGLVLSWLRAMKMASLGDFTPIELYKSELHERLHYSATHDPQLYPYRSSRVTFKPAGFRALLESLPPREGPISTECSDHSGLVANQLSYLESLSLLDSLGDIVPIHVLPPVPICITESEDTVKETCDGADGTTIHILHVACTSSCQVLCQYRRQPECENKCQVDLQTTYDLYRDELETTITCKGVCQGPCQSKCEYGPGCELGCVTSCEPTCQLACESKCQIQCEFFCQEECESTCQDKCQNYCQNDCEGKCQSNCQQGCQKRCEDSCESYHQICSKGCQAACQTDRQVKCREACEVACQSQFQQGECKTPGSTCDAGAECGAPSGMQASGDCISSEQGGCLTIVESCKTRSEGHFKYANTQPCNYLKQLPHTPQPTYSYGTPTIKLSGARIANVSVVAYGIDLQGHTEAYWGVTDSQGQVTLRVPLRELTVEPVWFDYPKLKFDPPKLTIDFGVDPRPRINFNVAVVPGGTRGYCVALSSTWCGWKGEWDVKEPRSVKGYQREPHDSWERATIAEYGAFLLEAGFSPNSIADKQLHAFWNHGQIVFQAPEEDIGEVKFLLLYDADYRYVADGGKLIAWSPLISPLQVKAGQNLKIPHHSQIFFLLTKDMGKHKPLGDHIADQHSVPVQLLLPTICEHSCQLTCQESCTTDCEVAHNDTCTAGCTSWCTISKEVDCKKQKQTSPNPCLSGSCQAGSCQAGSCTSSATGGCQYGCTTNQTIRGRATRTWDWSEPIPKESWKGFPETIHWTPRPQPNVEDVGQWTDEEGDPPGAIYSQALAEDIVGSHAVRSWVLQTTWKKLFDVPDNALVTHIRLVKLAVKGYVEGGGIASYGHLDDLGGVKSALYTHVAPRPLWDGMIVSGKLDYWYYVTGPSVFWPVEKHHGTPREHLYFDMVSYFKLDKTPGNKARLYYDNLTLEILYEVNKTPGCTNRCQNKCETVCEVGCAAECHEGCQLRCQVICEVHCEVVRNQIPGCVTGCQVTCQSGYCQSAYTLVPIEAYQARCASTCQKSCQTGCQFECQKKCEYESQTNCDRTCQLYCQTSCQRFCQLGSQGIVSRRRSGCRSSWQSDATTCVYQSVNLSCLSMVCETRFQCSCNGVCESWNQFNVCVFDCMNACQGGDTGAGQICRTRCQQSCQLNYEMACGSQCQVRSQIACEANSCQAACEAEPMTVQCGRKCQQLCQGGCEIGCQESCESTKCQLNCESLGKQ